VLDPIGGAHLWASRKTLRRGGKDVGYGLISSLRGEGLKSTPPRRRQRFRGSCIFARLILWSYVLPGNKRIIPYSIQTLKRLQPVQFRTDLTELLILLLEHQQKIHPLVANKLPLTEAKQAHELLNQGGVAGKIVLVCENK